MNTQREIKFRMWSKEVKKFFFDPENVYHCLKLSKNEETSHLYEDMVWQQFTGLKDSKGIDVYEGDIVEFLHKGKTIFSKISYYSNVGMFAVVIEPNQEIDIETRKCLAEVCFFEVIGNIFKNSELLENKD